MPTAAELFVRCLENEGVQYVFGIPGEETLDLNDAIDGSESVSFLPVRHEQGAAFMADAYGRLTGRAGVCLGTLGPGATNLLTGIADAYLDSFHGDAARRRDAISLAGPESVQVVAVDGENWYADPLTHGIVGFCPTGLGRTFAATPE